MTPESITKQAIKVVSHHAFAKVILNKSNGQKALVSTSRFKPGEVISTFAAGTTQSYATYLTVQTGNDKHITLEPEFLQYINHSCDPTVFFDTTAMELVCLQPLKPGDELTFFYPSTEWDMAQPFICHCGSPECLNIIQGAAHIPFDIIKKYKLTDFIREKVHARQK